MTTLVIHKGIEKSIFNKGFSQRVIGVVGFGKSRLTLELTKVSQQQNRWCWLYLGSDLHDYTMVKSLSLFFRIHWTGLFLAYQLPAFEKDVEKPHLICGIMDLAGKIDMHDMKWIPIGRLKMISMKHLKIWTHKIWIYVISLEDTYTM
ncbi:hypothetical protein P8452_55890 [Trifolium repens]|nr:hypothetical protein P8452_55890 [Trifolium repens]